jgi:hypothetical protein
MTRPRTLTTYPKPPLLNAVLLLAGFDTIIYSSRARISPVFGDHKGAIDIIPCRVIPS